MSLALRDPGGKTKDTQSTHRLSGTAKQDSTTRKPNKSIPKSSFHPRTWQLAQLMSAPFASRCLKKAGRSRGSEEICSTSATPPVMSTMAS
ncbi:hypothetical protein EYF80_041809 [Liparis tanakae]|uniref:Uncharacterized protein n=1 Tax=Liparis tanakae TaxID=230148 RepID=A0A4Z2G338_9TELE|nr:hypothetical protein EYF80_041809 [Liparis tanakae]